MSTPNNSTTEHLYEIHITTNCDLFLLNAVCSSHKYQYIVVQNQKGKYAQQAIVTKWVMRTSHKEAVERAYEIAYILKENGLEITRIKVELELTNFPEDYYLQNDDKMEKDFKQYYEFHIKIPFENRENALVELKTLSNYCNEHKLGLSSLVQSKCSDFKPIVTLRLRDPGMSKKDAMAKKASMIQDLKSKGFVLSTKIHQECAIFDYDPLNMDEDWLL